MNNGDINAKVGNGWMPIDRFIETFEGLEEEKKKIGITYGSTSKDLI